MFGKSLVFVCLLALFAFQGMEASQLSVRSARLNAVIVKLRGLRGVVDEIKDIISKLNEILDSIIAKAVDSLNGLTDTVKELKDKFLDKAVTKIKKIVSDALDFIAEKVKDAAKAGVDIAVCVVGKNELIIGLGNKLISQVTSCITDPVNVVLKVITDDLKIISDITTSIIGLPIKLMECGDAFLPPLCYAGLAVDAGALLFGLPGKITDIVSSAMNLVPNLTNKLGGCVDGITDIATKQVGDVIDEFKKCVDVLMPGHYRRI